MLKIADYFEQIQNEKIACGLGAHELISIILQKMQFWKNLGDNINKICSPAFSSFAKIST